MNSDKKFITYIIKSDSINKFYIGYTSDSEKRLKKHNTKSNKWTKRGVPWKVVYTKEFPTKSQAIKHERYLKKLKNKTYLEKLSQEWTSTSSRS
jgi:putative endonuclease